MSTNTSLKIQNAFSVLDFTDEDVVIAGELTDHLTTLFGGTPVRKILLINPPDVQEELFDFDTAKRCRANNYPTYGLGVIARHLMNSGYDPKICNLNHELLKKVAVSENSDDFDYTATWKGILFDSIAEFQPDLIAITCIFSAQTTNISSSSSSSNYCWRW